MKKTKGLLDDFIYHDIYGGENMRKTIISVIYTIPILFIISGCSSKALAVPDFNSINSIQMIYTNEENTFASMESIDTQSPTPSYYAYLSNAKYIKKMGDNNMLEVANVMIVFTLNDQSKITYTIYQDDNKTYLEDNDHLELYTINNEVFDTITNNFNINNSIN